MTNLWLFLGTVVVYTAVVAVVDYYAGLSIKSTLKAAGLLSVLCLPVNINGNVFTVIGNAESEKSVWSVCSLYQKAEENAVTVFGLAGYQQAEKDAVTFIGLAGYQLAREDTITVGGLAGYQQAGKIAGVGFGLAGYQQARISAMNFIGLAGYQQAGMDAWIFIGLVGYQHAGEEVMTSIGMAGYQQVPGKTRLFGAFSKLTVD